MPHKSALSPILLLFLPLSSDTLPSRIVSSSRPTNPCDALTTRFLRSSSNATSKPHPSLIFDSYRRFRRCWSLIFEGKICFLCVPYCILFLPSDLNIYPVGSRSRLSIKHPHAIEQAPTFRFGRMHQEPRIKDSILLSTQAHAPQSFSPLVSSILHSYLSGASIYDEILAGNLVSIFDFEFFYHFFSFSSSFFCLPQNHAIVIYCGLYYFSYISCLLFL